MSRLIESQSLYIYDVSSAVKNGKLYLDSEIVIGDLVNEDFFRRKSLINFEFVNFFEQSMMISIEQKKLVKHGCFQMDFDSTILADFGGIILNTEQLNLTDGEKYYYQVYVFIHIPNCSLSLEEEKRKEYKYRESEIFNICVVISDSPLNNDVKCYTNNKIYYDMFGPLGFMLVDTNKLNGFLTNYDRYISNDLFDEFTTTELASDIFDAGLMCLCWGMTPWHYYIYSECENDKLSFPKGKLSDFSGVYKFDESIDTVSVIPGKYMKDWQYCLNNEWPKLKLIGSGDGISISLYINNEMSSIERAQTGIESPLALFYIKRINLNEKEDVQPLLALSLFD